MTICKYKEFAAVLLQLWMDDLLTDAEYNRIMDRINEAWRQTERSE